MRLWCLLVTSALGASRDNFRTCRQSPFCRRYRLFQAAQQTKPVSYWRVINHALDEDSVDFVLESSAPRPATIPPTPVTASLSLYRPGFARLQLTEDPKKLPKGIRPRFQTPNEDVILDSELKRLVIDPRSAMVSASDDNGLQLQYNVSKSIHPLTGDTTSAVSLEFHVDFEPFRVAFFIDGRLAAVTNYQNGLNIELGRVQPDNSDSAHTFDATGWDTSDLWDYTFARQQEQIPEGPRGIGLDIAYCDVVSMHGLAEHAVAWDLPDVFPNPSDLDEPYRFWNSDVFAYELDSPMALYASLPMLQTVHSVDMATRDVSVSGTLWLNSAETFVKLSRSDPHQISYRSNECQGVSTWWASETGAMDLLFFGSKNIEESIRKLREATGNPAMQQLNTLGVHQCRWNYENEKDVRFVNDQFDSAGLPMDYIWLDIDHTVHRKYFTWNPTTFPTPQNMVDNLVSSKRNMVVIVDPHVKAESGYSVYDEMSKSKVFVTDREGKEFDGWCWPGNSRYPDVLRPEARNAYIDHYKPDKWAGTKPSPEGPHLPTKAFSKWLNAAGHVQLWNDMNEPSVFNKAEVTIPRDVLHLDGTVEHRAVHNLYGIYFHRATSDALIAARKDNRRPFVLTRAASPGSHRYAAIWTGDNAARWDHMTISVPMLLHLAACGFDFAGADIGGFFENTSPNLMVRWTQLGAWYPFMRYHATLGTARRELYLLPEPQLELAKHALKYRYRLLPFWYTLMARSAMAGTPMISSIGDFELRQRQSLGNNLLSAPSTLNFLSRDDGFLVGDTFFVRPITLPDREFSNSENNPVVQRARRFVLPGTQQTIWYNFWTNEFVGSGGRTVFLPVGAPNEWSFFKYGPVMVRGGTIVPIKERQRRSSEAMRFDPYTLMVYLDQDGTAKGSLMLDDWVSESSTAKGEFAWIDFIAAKETSSQWVTRVESVKGDIKTWRDKQNTDVKRLVVVGLEKAPWKISLLREDGKREDLLARGGVEGLISIKLPKNLSLTDTTWRLEAVRNG